LKIDFIRNFIRLCENKSFSELARDINISQSTLSHQISQLEAELWDIKLIARTTRKFNLTDAGNIFLDYAKKIVDLYDGCINELSVYKDDTSEEIVISSSTFPGSHILPKFIANFKTKYSNANFKILINNSQKSMEMLKKNIVDFVGIGSFMKEDEKDFDYIKIGEDTIKFICSPNHELLKNEGDSIYFDDILNFPIIMREKGSGTRDIIEHQFERFNELNIKLEINDNDSIISAVSESNYLSLMSELIANNSEKAGLIKVLKVKEFAIIAKRDIYFVKSKENHLSNLKKKFWESLEA